MGPVRIQSLVLGAASLAALYGAGGARVRALDAPQPKAQSVSNIVETLVGGGSIEGYRAREANLALGGSQGLALSARGEVYFSDGNRQQVLKFDPATGSISLVAGDGSKSYGGDGLPATSASLNQPAALTFDAAGNLLIADRGNFVVRRVDALSGVITTIAGTGRFTGQVVGNDPPAPLGDGGPATSATFVSITGIVAALDDTVYIADEGAHRIRVVDPTNQTISTYAGTGASGQGNDGEALLSTTFLGPSDVELADDGGLYVADQGRVRHLKSDVASPINTTVAGDPLGGLGGIGDGGPPLAATFTAIRGISCYIDPANPANTMLLVSDTSDHVVRLIDLTAGTVTLVAGQHGMPGNAADFGPGTGLLGAPRGIAGLPGQFTFADQDDGKIRTRLLFGLQ
jgi:hypothetical protein